MIDIRRHRVLIVDDHPIVRHGLRRMIDAEPDLVVCGEAQSDREARAAIRELSPDIMIVDVSLAQGDGLDLVRRLIAQSAGRTRYLGLELGDGQAAEAKTLCESAGYALIRILPDLTGRERILVAEAGPSRN